MKALSIRDMQERQLLILDHISHFCCERDIKYILIGGALLGAVRTGSLISWDDDIDLFMFRDDYRRFVAEYEDDEQYRLLESSRVTEYYYPFAKVCDRRTVMEENVGCIGMRSLDCLGVGVDIFPIDYLPSNKLKAFWLILQQRALQGLCYRDFRYSDPKRVPLYMRVVLSCFKKMKKLEGSCVGEYVDAMDKLWVDGVKSCCMIDTWTYQRYSTDGLLPLGVVELEGRRYVAPGNCKKFLTECYGSDYMTPRNTQPDGHGVAYLL